jgi:hypothetical protein
MAIHPWGEKAVFGSRLPDVGSYPRGRFMGSFHLLRHAHWGHELSLKKSPHPQPLSHRMGEGGRKAG